jgi:hypothetical protein
VLKEAKEQRGAFTRSVEAMEDIRANWMPAIEDDQSMSVTWVSTCSTITTFPEGIHRWKYCLDDSISFVTS